MLFLTALLRGWFPLRCVAGRMEGVPLIMERAWRCTADMELWRLLEFASLVIELKLLAMSLGSKDPYWEVEGGKARGGMLVNRPLDLKESGGKESDSNDDVKNAVLLLLLLLL